MNNDIPVAKTSKYSGDLDDRLLQVRYSANMREFTYQIHKILLCELIKIQYQKNYYVESSTI